MTHKEETINAIQNIGAVLFIIGLLLCITIDSVTVLIISYGLASVGALLIYSAEYMVNKLEQWQNKKMRGE